MRRAGRPAPVDHLHGAGDVVVEGPAPATEDHREEAQPEDEAEGEGHRSPRRLAGARRLPVLGEDPQTDLLMQKELG